MATEIDYRTIEKMFQSYLRMDTHLVAVKIVEREMDYANLEMATYKGKSYYCQMVKKAVGGKTIKASLEHMSCETGSRMLGLEPYFEDQEDIDGWHDANLFENRDLADRQHQFVRPIDSRTSGIIVSPLSKISLRPDLVLVACNAYQAMRLSQAYTYSYGVVKDISLSGHCGVCFESTAKPLTESAFSMSLLCSGTRFVSKWDDNTMMVSFPYDMCDQILTGLTKTANHVEPDDYKKAIKKRLVENDIDAYEYLDNGTAYFYKGDKH